MRDYQSDCDKLHGTTRLPSFLSTLAKRQLLLLFENISVNWWLIKSTLHSHGLVVV